MGHWARPANGGCAVTAYYNDNNPQAAAWLRELIKAGHIADGDVDERSITEVDAVDVAGFTQCHFFAGIGGWSHALRLAGWPDDKPVWTGSCPCQPFSTAGKRSGFADERHLWPHFFRLISQCRPDVCFGEQVASQDGLAWLDTVCADLEGADYACGAVDTCAAGFGAPHIRQRLFWVANANGAGLQGGDSGWADTEREVVNGHIGCGSAAYRPGPTNGHWRDADWLYCRDGKWRPVEPGTFPLAHGLPARVVRLRGYGNAIVPQVAAEFVSAFMEVNP